MRAVVLVALLAATALADPAADPTADEVTGFLTYGAGPISGRLTDAGGKPLAGVAVHALSKSGKDRTAMTDKDGNYRVELAGAATEESLVFVRGKQGAHLSGERAEIVSAGSDGEAIAVQAMVPPAVMPRPKTDPEMIPDYSDVAMDKNTWARAWLLLEVDTHGNVARLKFLKRPGLDLDRIALATAFKLTFEPARDRANHPVRAMTLWSMEWPSYYMLVNQHYDLRLGLPSWAKKARCQGPGQHEPEDRDCSRPDLVRGLYESWIAPRR